jgi:hypothetical protein
VTFGRICYDSCGCCATYADVEVVGRVLMPDGKELLQVQDVSSDVRWWIDTDLDGLFLEND